MPLRPSFLRTDPFLRKRAGFVCVEESFDTTVNMGYWRGCTLYNPRAPGPRPGSRFVHKNASVVQDHPQRRQEVTLGDVRQVSAVKMDETAGRALVRVYQKYGYYACRAFP